MDLRLFGKEGFYGWIVLAAAGVLGIVGGGGMFYSFGAFLPSICKEFGWSRGLVSGALAMFIIIVSLSAPAVGFFVSKYGPRMALVVGNTVGVAGLLLLAVHKQIWQFYTAYGVLIGLGVGLGGFIAVTALANNWFRKKAPLAMGIVVGAIGFGGIVMIPVIVYMIENMGWRRAYMVLAGLVFLFAVVIPGLLIRNKPEDLGQRPDGALLSEASQVDGTPQAAGHATPADFSVKEALRTRALWLLVIANTSIIFLLTILMAHQVAFLQGIGISAAVAGMLLGLISGTSTLGNLLMGFLALKFNLKNLSLAGFFLMFLSAVLLIFTASLPMAVAYTVLFGFGYGMSWIGITSFVAAYFGPKNYPQIYGNVMIFSAIGNFGAPLAGIIFDMMKSYHIAFIAGLVAAIAGFAAMVFMKQPVRLSGKG